MLSVCVEVIVSGDVFVLSILVVLIFVKVMCDCMLVDLYECFLVYGFNVYVGYGIVKYFVVLCEYGLCEVYWCLFVLVCVVFDLI